MQKKCKLKQMITIKNRNSHSDIAVIADIILKVSDRPQSKRHLSETYECRTVRNL